MVTVALLLATGGCHHKKSGNKSTRGVHVQDLKLDLSGAKSSKAHPPAEAGTLGITLEALKKRWNEKAAAHKVSPVSRWLRQPIPAFQAWRAEWRLGPGLDLQVFGVGKDAVQTVQVTMERLTLHDRARMFNAWETLREAVTPDISQEQLYKGLGLLSPPTKRTRYEDEGGYVYQLTYAPLRRVPGGGLVMSVRRKQPKPDAKKPFSMLVHFGGAGTYGSIGSFTLEYAPSSRGKAFEQAAQLCDKQGLSLCTDAQWQRACSQLGDIKAISTWTASFNKKLTKLQTRGGSKCDSGDAVGPDDKDAKRGAICCTSGVAMTSSTTEALKGLFAIPALAYEQAVNHRNKQQLAATLAPTLSHFYTLDNAKLADAVKFAMDDANKNPGRWSSLQSCNLKRASKELHFLLDCGKATFQGNQGMATMTEYGVFRNRIELLKDTKVMRKMGPI